MIRPVAENTPLSGVGYLKLLSRAPFPCICIVLDGNELTGTGTVQAFAGGATISVLANTLMPEAYKDGGWWVGFATALGFFVAFVLGG